MTQQTGDVKVDELLAQVEAAGWYVMADGSLVTSYEVSLTDSRVPSASVREDVNRFFARGPTFAEALRAAFIKAQAGSHP